MTGIQRFCFILLILFSYAYAQFGSEVATRFQSVWSSSSFPWQILAIIGVMIGFSYSAIAFMLSKVFSSSDLEKVAKYEFLYSLSSLVLVAFIVVVVDILAVKSGQYVFLLSQSLGDSVFLNNLKERIQESGYSPFVIAKFYVESTAVIARVRYKEAFCAAYPFFILTTLGENSAKATSLRTGKTRELFDFLSKKNPISQVSMAGVSFITSSLQRAMMNLSYLLYSLYFQGHLLRFIEATVLTIFL
ncbi:MAG: hypothetical protein NZ903_01945, partial [Candidatus Micrarchaeota archaeon]|nr:hypothetical protein [Candidatus Micrarchaeota archaeon]